MRMDHDFLHDRDDDDGMSTNAYEFSRCFVRDNDPSGSEIRATVLLPAPSLAVSSRMPYVLAILTLLTLLTGILRVVTA